MASKSELYRKQVAMAVAVKLRITLDDALSRTEDHMDMIEVWGEKGIPFTDTATFLVAEIS